MLCYIYADKDVKSRNCRNITPIPTIDKIFIILNEFYNSQILQLNQKTSRYIFKNDQSAYGREP